MTEPVERSPHYWIGYFRSGEGAAIDIAEQAIAELESAQGIRRHPLRTMLEARQRTYENACDECKEALR